MSEDWLLILPLGARPPTWAALHRSKKCWWRKVKNERRSLELKSALAALGYHCKTVAASDRQRPAKSLSPAHPSRIPQAAPHERAAFEQFKQDMATPPILPQILPEPKNGPSFGRSPGLSKAAPKRHR